MSVFFQNHRFSTFLPSLVFTLVAVMCTSGCGNNGREYAPVTGKVTYRGAPLQFGTVVMQPPSGQFASGEIQPDGTFRMSTPKEGDVVLVGKSQVRVYCYEGQSPERKQAAEQNANEPPESRGGLGRSLIPHKYSSYRTSGIVVDVRSGENDPVIIELKDN